MTRDRAPRLWPALALVFGSAGMPASASPAVLTAVNPDQHLVARVLASAFSFTVPRLLDPADPGRLSLWGLRGVTTLDPALAVSRHGTEIWLTREPEKLLAEAAPADDDSDGWARVDAALLQAAWDASAQLRQAGAPALLPAFFGEMFAHSDPYSRYVPAAPAEEERDRLSIDAESGLGLTRQKNGVVVSDVVPSGPGALAGARVGDRIVGIDGQNVSHASLARIQALLTGPEGTQVTLQVRGLDGATRNIDLSLAYVPPETVFSEWEDGMLVLRVTSFTSNTAERLSQAVEAGMAASPPPRAIVLDVRGNRGGLLRQAVNAVALFAETGTIASTAGRDPAATHAWRIDGGGDLTHGAHLIILVDGRTASAAEILAAGLADLGRGVVVGSATLGKGLVQTITRLPDGGELFVTWSRVLAPRGWPLQSLGVLPQLCTSGSIDALTKAESQLTAGVQPLMKELDASRAARAPLTVAEALKLRAPCPAADGTDTDLQAARFLADHPPAYAAALLK